MLKKNNTYKLNEKEALEAIQKVKTIMELYYWHKKYTPWFNDQLLWKITEQEWKEEMEKNNNSFELIKE